ncbi:MAG TPA: LysR substrate-binding domain-containing protein [Terriglobales bacterium]|nr:LysR substrate-binding domain-containing protein [Terriglobales bacterium]
MSDRLGGIAAFVQATESGSFALAAERLNLTRSAVGKSIARLEQRLGVRLFHRTTRSLSLTEDGQTFYESCLRALKELETAEAALDSGRQSVNGRLRVSMANVFGRHCVAPILLELARQHPGLELDLSFNDRPVDLIEDGFDLAIRGGNVPDQSGLMIRRLGEQRMIVVAAPAYLARHEGVVYGRGSQIKPWSFKGPEGRLIQQEIRCRLRLDDVEALVDAALSGAGLGWLPCWLIAPHVKRGALVPVLSPDLAIGYPMYAVWPQSPHLPLRTRLAIDALAAQLPLRLSEMTANRQAG